MARDVYVHAPSVARERRARQARVRSGPGHGRRPFSRMSGRPGGHPERIRLDPAPGLAGTMAPMPDLLDDLDQRGLVHDTTDRAALAARLAEGPITLYYGCDPTAPSLHHGNLIGLIMLRRFQDAGHRPHRAGRRSHRDDRRSGRPLRGAQPPRRRDAGRQRGRHQGADQPHPGPGGALDARRQPLVDRRPPPPRLPPRRRQARHREPDGGPGEREGPHGERARHLLHGVQLHAPAGQRLRPPAPARGLRAPDRRLRPVGQHPLRASTSSAAAGAPPCTPCAGRCSPPTTARRSARPPAPGCGSIPTSPRPYAFFQHWINTDDAEVRRMLAQFTLLPMAEIDALAGGARRRPRPARGPAGAGAGGHRRSSTAPTAPPGRRAGQRRPLRRRSPAGVARRRWPRSAREVPVHRAGRRARPSPPASTSAPCCSARGLASSQSDARRQLEQGGVSVNGDKADPDRRLGRRRPARTAAGCCCARGRRAGRCSICTPGKLTLSRIHR